MENTKKNKEITHNIILPQNIKVGDIIVVRYKKSQWADLLKWENWYHAAIVSQVHPLTIIEAAGKNSGDQFPGPTEVLFSESILFGKASGDIIKMKWLKPRFPRIMREYAKWYIPWIFRPLIEEKEARKRVIQYAREQVKNKDPYNIDATKWDENEWYCSLLVYKSYSKTITGMYLEDYGVARSGRLVFRYE